MAELATHDQAIALAEAAVPARRCAGLGEAGVAADALDPAAQHQRSGQPIAREHQVVGVDVFGAQRRIGEGGIPVVRQRIGVVAVVGHVGPSLAQRVHGSDRSEVVVDLAAAAADQLDAPAVHEVGLLVGRLRADGVPAVEPGEGGDAVLQCQCLATLRVVQLGQRLVAAVVDIAAVPAQPHAGAAVGAVAQAGGVDVALCGGQRHRDRHVVALCLFGVRLDVDRREVVQPGQRFAQAVELALVVVAAGVPVDELLQQFLAHHRVRCLVECQRAHVVALPAGPGQVDVGCLVCAGHLDPAAGKVGIEVTTHRQAAADGGLAGLVQAVVEDVTRTWQEVLEVIGEIAVAASFSLDGDVETAYPHRRAGIDIDGDVHRTLVAAALDFDGRRVITEGLKRLAGLVVGLAYKIGHAPAGDFQPLRLHQRQRRTHVFGHFLVEAADLDRPDLGGVHGAADRQGHGHARDGNAGG